MDNDSVWFQPPAYVTQMAHDTYQPNLIQAALDRTVPNLNHAADRSEDRDVVPLKFTNSGSEELGVSVLLQGLSAQLNKLTITTLNAGSLSDTNAAYSPDHVKPSVKTLEKGVRENKVLVTVAPRSYTVVKIERGGQQALVPGGLGSNGEVTIQDVMEACKVLARQLAGKAPTEDEMRRGNLDGDMAFTIGDVMEICKILARKA